MRISKNRVSYGNRRVTAGNDSPPISVHVFNLLLISGEKQTTSPEAIVDEARIATWTDILDSNVSNVARDNESTGQIMRMYLDFHANIVVLGE